MKKREEEYTGKQLINLDAMEHIRKRYGMYIGSNESATPLVNEALDNSVDEVMAGFGNKILLERSGEQMSVTDWGRGIPIDDVQGMPGPVFVATTINSGGKFNTNVYKCSAGLNGVGLVLINALSKFMSFDVYRQDHNGKKLRKAFFHFHCEFNYGKLVISSVKEVPEKPFSTKVSFVPDDKRFKTASINIAHIRNRLELMAAQTGATIILNDDGDVQQIRTTISEFFKTHYVFEDDTLLFDPIEIKVESQDQEVIDGQKVIRHKELQVIFSYAHGTKRSIGGSVNLLNAQVGSHISAISTSFCNVLYELGQQKKILIEKPDGTVGIRCLVNLFLPEPVFGGQTKEKLESDRSEFESVIQKFEAELLIKLKNTPETKMVLEQIRLYRTKLSNVDIFKKKTIRGNTSKDDPLVDCKLDNGELYLVEGESAGGSFKDARNSSIHAILALKGKPLNIVNQPLAKVLVNVEMASLIRALGVDLKPKDGIKDLKQLHYQKIIISCDADDDGKHIAVLLLGFFLRFYPELIQAGHVFVLEAPLFKIQTPRKEFVAWSREEVNKIIKDYPKHDITRFKGLGEMNPDQVAKYLLDPNIRRLIRVDYVADEQYLFRLLTDSQAKKELVGI